MLKKNKKRKNVRNIYGVYIYIYALKIGSFFGKDIVGYENENQGVIEDLKKERKKILIKKIIVKIYLGISLELLWAVWVQFSFR